MAETVRWYQTHPDWLAHLMARNDGFLDRALALASNAGTER
jgi:hypothetical protein